MSDSQCLYQLTISKIISIVSINIIVYNLRILKLFCFIKAFFHKNLNIKAKLPSLLIVLHISIQLHKFFLNNYSLHCFTNFKFVII